MSNPPIPYLHTLPAEIWLACWTLCSSRQLRRISLVCQLFRSLCFPLLLQHQDFDIAAVEKTLDRKNWIDPVCRLHRTAVRLDRLAEGHHALLVQSWKFSARHSVYRVAPRYPQIPNLGLFDAVYDRVIATFSATLARYQNLQSLDIRGLTIDTSFKDTLLSLSVLDHLTLDGCDIIAREGPLMKLKSFAISEIRSPDAQAPVEHPLQIASREHLQNLQLHARDKTWSLITGFGPGKFTHLVSVSLDVLSHVQLFFSFLRQCPRLESLEIKSVSRYPIITLPESLSLDTASGLRHLTAPSRLIRLFAPGRPVSMVKALVDWTVAQAGDENLLPVLLDISHTSAPLLSLGIASRAPSDESLAALASLFPCLRELSIDILDGPVNINICRFSRRRSHSVDDRCPSLGDDTAFDELLPDGVSDAEEDTSSATVVIVEQKELPDDRFPAFTRLVDMFNRINKDGISLPPTIEVLRLKTDSPDLLPISLAKRHQVLARLLEQCPLLREVQLGLPSYAWKRIGALWKQEGVESYVQVNPQCVT
ncbi:hypothetical protein FB451DRAFT_1261744 [Mycena latifolia]|nr:hypothetical protein FB451DRAFT_1261744 [Mycena latifolia]